MANSYLDMQSFRTEKVRLRLERDHALGRVEQHWDILRTPATRGILLRDAVGDAIGSWKPVKAIRDLMHGNVSGNVLSTVGSVYAATRPTWTKRALFGGLNWAVGKVIGETSEEGPPTLHTAARAIGTFLRTRREKRALKAKQSEHVGF